MGVEGWEGKGVLYGFWIPAYAGMTSGFGDGLVPGFWYPLRAVRAGLKPAPTLFAGPPLNIPKEGEGWRRFCNGLAPGL